MKDKLCSLLAVFVFAVLSSTCSLDAQVMHPGPRLGCPLCALNLELQSVERPTVVYSAIKDPESGLVRIIRMSAQPNHTPVSSYVDAKPMQFDDWDRYARIASDPGAEGDRKRLKEAMLGGRGDDGDALVFFEDRTGANVNPSVLGLDGAAQKSGTLEASASRRVALTAKREPMPKFDAYLGFPITEVESKAIFADIETASLGEWQAQHKTFVGNAGQRNITVVDTTAIRALKTKEAFLSKLRQSENIIFIVVHGDKAEIRLLGNEPFTITAEDIAALNLEKKPFVFLRVCESNAGDNAKFAKAFIKAGASGVSYNNGKIAASDATAEAFRFVDAIKETRSILEALNRITADEKVRVRTELMTLLKRIRNSDNG